MKLQIRKAALITLPILLLIAGGFYYVKYYRPAVESTLYKGLETTPVSRGTVISKVGSTGKARANQTAVLTWKTSGSIGKVNVKNSDMVKTGDVLMELDPESYPSTILQALEDLPAAQRNLDNLNISDVKRTQAKEDLAKAEIAYKNAKDDRELKNQRNTSDTNLADAEAVYLQAKSNLESMKTVYSYMQDKPEDDLGRAQMAAQLSRAQKNYDWAVLNYQWAQNKPLPEDVKISEANLKVAEATLADAKRNWEKVKDNPDPDDMTSVKTNVDALLSTIDQVKITAPISGQVSSLTLLPGDLIKNGQAALTVVDTSKMFLDISISEVDINRIHLNQNVSFTFDAIPGEAYQGTITEISSIGNSVSGVIYFDVTCEITKFDNELKPGMTAAASIDAEKKEDVLVVPTSSIVVKNSNRYVFILDGKKIRQIEIKTGIFSDSQIDQKK